MKAEITLKWWHLYALVVGLPCLGVGVTHISYGSWEKGIPSILILPAMCLYYLLFKWLDKKYPNKKKAKAK